jgi:elongation factor 3
MSPVAVNVNGAGHGSEQGSATPSAILQRLYSAPDAVQCSEAAAELATYINTRGLRTLEEADISSDIIRASKNAKSGFEREGAMVALEEIFRRVGGGSGPGKGGAEPYFLPFIGPIADRLAEQGKAEVVRDAALKAGKQLVTLPPAEFAPKFIEAIFEAMESSSVKWKTKVGLIEMLATFPSRAKEQIAERLGEYIPRIETQMRDTKADVSSRP